MLPDCGTASHDGTDPAVGYHPDPVSFSRICHNQSPTHQSGLGTLLYNGFKERAMGSPERAQKIVKYILDQFAQKTKRSSYCPVNG